jgi:hypothetical protein
MKSPLIYREVDVTFRRSSLDAKAQRSWQRFLAENVPLLDQCGVPMIARQSLRDFTYWVHHGYFPGFSTVRTAMDLSADDTRRLDELMFKFEASGLRSIPSRWWSVAGTSNEVD